MRKAFISTLCELARKDPQVMLVTGDLGYNFFEPFISEFPKQFLNIGIMEQTMASVCAGLAFEGRTVFMYSIGNFPTLRCLEQLRNDVCYHRLNVKVCSNGAGMAYGYLGMTHHATEDIAAMRALPEMRVVVPADPVEVVAGVNYVYANQGPAFLRMARGKEPDLHGPGLSFTGEDVLPLVRGGGPVILACGEIAHVAVAAATLLKEHGIDSSVYSCPIVSPFPVASVQSVLQGAPAVFTLEEHNLAGGFGSAVLESLNDAATDPVPRIHRIGLDHTYTRIVGKQDYLRDYYGLSAAKVSAEVIRVLEK